MNAVLSYLAENPDRLGCHDLGPCSRFSCVLLTRWLSPASRHIVFVVVDSDSAQPVFIARMPRIPCDDTQLNREIRNLRLAQAVRPSGFDSIPRVVAAEMTASGTLLIETALQGTPMTPALLRGRFWECVQAVADWLIDFHQATARDHGCNYDELLERPLHRWAHLIAPEDAWLLPRTLEVTAPLRQARFPAVFEHGDLRDANLLLANGRAAVLDWETAMPHCFPAGDLFFFLTYAAWAHAGHCDCDSDFTRALHHTFLPLAGWVQPFVRAYFRALDLDPQLQAPLFAAFWARYFLGFAERVTADDILPPINQAEDNRELGRYYRLWRYALCNIDRLHWTD